MKTGRLFIAIIFVVSVFLILACQKKVVSSVSEVVETQEINEAVCIPDSMMTYCTGAVFVTLADGERIPAEPGMVLSPESRMETGPGSSCAFSIEGIGTFEVDENSLLVIDSFFIQQKRAALTLAAGAVCAKVSRLSKRDDCIVRTRTLVCGVRGTEFTVRQVPDGEVQVSVDSGTVAVFPAEMLTSGLHPASELVSDGVSLHDAVQKDREQFEAIWDNFPVLEEGEDKSFSSESLAESAGRVVEVKKTLDQGSSVKHIDEAFTHIIEPLVADTAKPVLLEKSPDPVVVVEKEPEIIVEQVPEKPRKIEVVRDTYSYTVDSVDPPEAFSVPGDFWPRPQVWNHVQTDKTVKNLFTSKTTVINKNPGRTASVSTGIKDGRAEVTLKNAEGTEWSACIQYRDTVVLREDSLYSIGFTAWTDGSPMRVNVYISEGGKDANMDGNSNTSYFWQHLQVTSTPNRYTIVYPHIHKTDKTGSYNVGVIGPAGTLYIQDLEMNEIRNGRYVHEGGQDEIIKNGSFAYGMLFWGTSNHTDSMVDHFSVKEGILQYSNRERSEEPWNKQITSFLPVDKGDQYILSFLMRSNTAGSFTVDIVETEHPFSSNSPTLTIDAVPGDWMKYELFFPISKSDPRAMLTFNLGHMIGDIQIDDFSLKRIR